MLNGFWVTLYNKFNIPMTVNIEAYSLITINSTGDRHAIVLYGDSEDDEVWVQYANEDYRDAAYGWLMMIMGTTDVTGE